jgi:shikimate kinase
MTIFFPIPVRFLEVSNRFLKKKGLKKTDVQVPASLFEKISDDVERERLKTVYISHLAGSSNKWMKRIKELLLSNSDIKIGITKLNVADKDEKKHVADKDNNVYMAHIVCHRDQTLIRLAMKLKEFSFSFPRGFAMLFNDEKIIGTAPFYPKFDNDDKDSFESVEKGEFTKGSFFVKYSGSLAKVAIWKGKDGEIYWTVTSKNSADSTSESGEAGVNYVKEMDVVLALYMTQETLKKIYASGVRSFCAEVMLKCDNVHGYRVIDGFIVTAAATTGRFLDSKQLAEWCRKIGLPTDFPLQINGKKEILEFIKELRNHRDVMTVDLLQKILKKNGLQYDLSKHRHIVQSLILEGFIITLRNEKGEKLVLKYKFAFYTAVTMFLRKYIQSKTNTKPTAKPFMVEDNISNFLDRWVFDKSVAMQSLWCWILHQMVRVADTETFEGPVAPWIQASEQVYARVFEALAANGNDAAKVCELLGCRMLEQQQRSLIEVTIALVLGPIGYGKSTFASYLAALIPNSVHIDGDGNEAWLPKNLVLALKGERNAETVAAILSAIQAGKNVVFSTGGGAIWSFPNCGQKAMNSQTISFLETKAKEMGIKLKFVVYVPENIEAAYADTEAVKSTIKGRKARGEKWGDDEKFIQNLCASSAKNIEFAKRFMKQGVEVHTYPRFIFDDMTNESALRAIFQSGTDLMSSNPQSPLELYCLRQQQLVSIGEISPPIISAEVRIKYGDPKIKGKLLFTFPKCGNDSTFHITIRYDADKTPKPLADPFFPVGSTQNVSLYYCIATLIDGTLAPFIFIDLGCGGMHVTVHPGRFKPESMREVALAMQAGQSSAMFVPQQGEPQELSFEVLSSQQVQIKAHNVVSHA